MIEKNSELPITSMFKHEGAVDKPIGPVKSSIARSSNKRKGQTYAEAVDFCLSNNQMLCDYEIICPFGQGAEAAGVGNGGKFVAEDNPYGLAWWCQ